MQFAPEKSELMHFTRARVVATQGIRVGGATVTPVESARFLGVRLDRKLQWGSHLKAVKEKIATQQLALTKLAASAWGCSLRLARSLYTAVLRPMITYGASA